MFCSQNEDYVKNRIYVYKTLYKEWCKEHPDSVSKMKSNSYLDRNFYEFLVLKYIEYLKEKDSSYNEKQLKLNLQRSIRKINNKNLPDEEKEEKIQSLIDKHDAELKELLKEYKEKDKNELKRKYERYRNAFGELVDLHIRKLMTKGSNLKASDNQKEDMYSDALYWVFNYAIDTYNPTRKDGNDFFVYATSAINSGFKNVFKVDSKQKEISKEAAKRGGIEAFAYNYEEKEVNDLEGMLNDFVEK